MKKSFLNWARQISAASYGLDEALAGGCRFMRPRPSMQWHWLCVPHGTHWQQNRFRICNIRDTKAGTRDELHILVVICATKID
jgi:hypothetical protein